ncbi:MAG: hypothetical protein JRJ03_02005 [Deltaproteobacteria bacterium]|nr:hypothetical protein [Deltaproteobacteria bacterium]
MTKYLVGYVSRPVLLRVFYLMFLFFLLLKPGLGLSENQSPGLTRCGLLTFNAKILGGLYASERLFRVTEETTIVDAYGKEITIEGLPVPCLAKVRYRLIMDQDPVLIKILVKELLPEWSTSFTRGE